MANSIDQALAWEARRRRVQSFRQRQLTARLELATQSTDDASASELALRAPALPYARYRDDAVGFCADILGVEVWSRQEEILRKAAAHKKVAVRSGHKVGKSKSSSILTAWWMETRTRGKVVLTSSSNDNIKNTLWPELRKVYRQARKPLGGHMLSSPQGGWRFEDGRSAFGVSTDTPERAAANSGDELLIIVDEASGIEDDIFEAFEGSLAGGGHMVMFGNPTQQTGQFRRAFTDEADIWVPIHISSEESPNVAARRIIIPGLATYDWVEERKKKWGVDSVEYQIRVKGNFAGKSANAVIGVDVVEEARKRWADTEETGELELGIDVARFGDDDSVIYPRRGPKALEPIVVHGLDTVDVAGTALKVARDLRHPGERVKIKVDTIGVGAGVADILRTHADIDVIDINVSEASVDPEEYPNLRTQLWFGMGDWLKEGGAIPESDAELRAELTAPRYSFDARGRRQVEPKENIKKRLKRSPDHAEALMLAIYSPPLLTWDPIVVKARY